MTNDQFLAEFGMTIEQAHEVIERKKQKNKESLDDLMIQIEALKGKQTLRSKLEWFQNLAKVKRELAELQNGS